MPDTMSVVINLDEIGSVAPELSICSGSCLAVNLRRLSAILRSAVVRLALLWEADNCGAVPAPPRVRPDFSNFAMTLTGRGKDAG